MLYKVGNFIQKSVKKLFIVVCLVAFAAPGSATLAITQDKINAEVQIVCPDNYGNYYSGSGTIIDSKGIILTNKHVVTDEHGGIIKTCVVGFVSSISQPPDFGTAPNLHLAEVKFYTTTSDLDAAILYLNNTTNQVYPFVNIWGSDSSALKFGDKIKVIGFPSIGGSTITYTSGDFSGFGSKSDGTQNYIKTTAQLEHGNSGGAAYNGDGQFIGIPTMVVSGTLNSLSYVLSVDSIKNWLSSNLGANYKQQVEVAPPPAVIAPSNEIKNDITPPSMDYAALDVYGYDENGTFINHSGWGDNGSPVIYEFPKVSFGWFQNCNTPLNYQSQVVASCITDNSGDVAGYYYYFGSNANANPVTEGKYISEEDLSKDTIYKNEGLYGYQRKLPVIFPVDKTKPNFFILRAKDRANNISSSLINFQYIYEVEDFKTLEKLSFFKDSSKLSPLVSFQVDFTPLISNKGYWYKDSHEIFCTTRLNSPTVQWDYPKSFNKYSVKNFNSYTPLKEISVNGNTISTNYYTITNLKNGNFIKIHSWDPTLSAEQSKIQDTEQIYYGFYLKPLTDSALLSEKHSLINLVYSPKVDRDMQCSSPYYTEIKQSSEKAAPDTGTSKVIGHILLQVQQHGEAWYVNPADGKRYYMKDGSVAYSMMRSFGLGITDTDLAKIPAVDNEQGMKDSASICSNNSTASKLKGKILLQVNQHGEAWYVHPDKCRRIYMKDGGVAYQIMRFLSLGITNIDLAKIPEGSL